MVLADTSINISNYAVFRAEVQRLFPWIEAWLTSPTVPALGEAPTTPRDFMRTPLALSIFKLSPHDVPFLSGADQPWEVLRRVLGEFYRRSSAAATPVQRAIIAGDPQLLAEAITATALADSISPAGAQNSAWDGVGSTGHTPLTLAALLGDTPMTALLLARGARPTLTDALGNTPLHWAAIVRHTGVRDALFAAGAQGGVDNLFGAQANDYNLAWEHVPPANLAIDLINRHGVPSTLTDAETFRRTLGFDYLPSVRPGIDFFVQMALGLGQPGWLADVHAELQRCPPFHRDAFPEVAFFVKDFGDPWGYGVCTHAPLSEGQPVTSYVGDLVHTFETMIQLLNHGANPYMSNAQPSPLSQQLFMCHFDAWRSGNLGSRLNSAEADGAQNLRFSCRFWRGLPRAQFFARRDIAAKEQLSWYYGDGYWAARGFPAQPLPRF